MQKYFHEKNIEASHKYFANERILDLEAEPEELH